MSSSAEDITTPGRPQVTGLSAGIYAYVQPHGSKRRVSRGRLGGTG